MKKLLVLCLGFLATSAFAGMNCVGTTVIFNNDGSARSIETQLKKVEGEKNNAVYFGESEVFRFWADHQEDTISLEILDKKDFIVLNNPKMPVARFNVSIGGYWKTYFASLNCTPIQN